MSSRRRPGQSWESFVDRQIREAQERGEFDRLPGRGRPLPDLDRPRDEGWWIRRKLKDEQFTRLPPALQLRKDRDVARARITAARTEEEARRILAEINAHIRYTNARIVGGPPSSVMPLDEELTMQAWRAARTAADPGEATDRPSGRSS